MLSSGTHAQLYAFLLSQSSYSENRAQQRLRLCRYMSNMQENWDSFPLLKNNQRITWSVRKAKINQTLKGNPNTFSRAVLWAVRAMLLLTKNDILYPEQGWKTTKARKITPTFPLVYWQAVLQTSPRISSTICWLLSHSQNMLNSSNRP